MICSPLLYFPKVVLAPVMPRTATWIKINNDIYYQDSFDTFKTFKITVNKRGGDTAEIEFVKPYQQYNINDAVYFYIKGKMVYRGYIEKITEQGSILTIIPAWGKLNQVFITDTLEIEETKNIKELVLGLQPKIVEAGVVFNANQIDIPDNKNMVSYDITTSMAGKSIATILEELEAELPTTCVWGVDANNIFYFKRFNDYTPSKKLNWHALHYSDDEISEDYSAIYSQYVVKHKKYDVVEEGTDTYEVLKYIVGSKEASSVIIDGKEYNWGPIQKWTEKVGIKTGTIEYNFESDKLEAYQYAYDMLQKQGADKTIEIDNLNIDKIRLNINECVGITTKPKQDIIKTISMKNYSDVSTISGNIIAGDVYRFGDYISSYKEQQKKSMECKLADIKTLQPYLYRALSIKELECNYVVDPGDTGGNAFQMEITDDWVNVKKASFNFITGAHGYGPLNIEIENYIYTSYKYFDIAKYTGDLESGNITTTTVLGITKDEDKTRFIFTPSGIYDNKNGGNLSLKIGQKVFKFKCMPGDFVFVDITKNEDGSSKWTLSFNFTVVATIDTTSKKVKFNIDISKYAPVDTTTTDLFDIVSADDVVVDNISFDYGASIDKTGDLNVKVDGNDFNNAKSVLITKIDDISFEDSGDTAGTELYALSINELSENLIMSITKEDYIKTYKFYPTHYVDKTKALLSLNINNYVFNFNTETFITVEQYKTLYFNLCSIYFNDQLIAHFEVDNEPLNISASAGTVSKNKTGYIGQGDITNRQLQEHITLADDDGNYYEAIGVNGVVVFKDIEKLDKYTAVISTTSREALWSSLKLTFDQYSEYEVLNVRELSYEYKSGTLDISATLSKLNTKLTGYLFEQNKRIDTLEKLLTSTTGEK